MNVEVELPDMGEDAGDEATVQEWFVEEGDPIEKGEVLLEVISDDTAFEVAATESGVLVEKLAEEEDLVRVGDIVAIIEVSEDPDEDEDLIEE